MSNYVPLRPINWMRQTVPRLAFRRDRRELVVRPDLIRAVHLFSRLHLCTPPPPTLRVATAPLQPMHSCARANGRDVYPPMRHIGFYWLPGDYTAPPCQPPTMPDVHRLRASRGMLWLPRGGQPWPRPLPYLCSCPWLPRRGGHPRAHSLRGWAPQSRRIAANCPRLLLLSLCVRYVHPCILCLYVLLGWQVGAWCFLFRFLLRES